MAGACKGQNEMEAVYERKIMKLKTQGANQTEIEQNGAYLFFSYNTLVLVRTKDNRVCQTSETYSRATSKHINQALERWNTSVDEIMSQEDLESLVKPGDK